MTTPTLILLALWTAVPVLEDLFTITVVDAETGRGVPLVELRTTSNLRFVTDSNGVVALREPELMGQRVYFHVESHGYEYPADGFGYRGQALDVTPGGSAQLELPRVNVAERLYRVTGSGIYRDSVIAGRSVPIREPLLNAQVFGSDSVQNIIYRGRIYWFWGDTNRPGYPLGNFHTPGATSLLPDDGGLDPEHGIDLDYFVAETGFAAELARMPGEGPTWISGLVILPDAEGRDRLYGSYVKVRPPLHVYQHGLIVFDDQANRFEKFVEFEEGEPFYPTGHTITLEENGTEYVYFPTPYPLHRVRADVESLQDLTTYEAFTCLEPGSLKDDPRIDRDEQGHVRYGWKAHTPALGPREQSDLIRDGHLKPEEGLLQLQDVETGTPVAAHSGSVYWNDHRRRWVMITGEVFGDPSFLGEIWYAEADTPLGPWVYARKVVTQDTYSFYNPKQHPMFDKEGGREIFFEGTYTTLFTNIEVPTPRYEYNQIMYKLDLDDPRLNLPVAYYDASEDRRFATVHDLAAETDVFRPAFFALERPGEGTIPVYQVEDEAGRSRLRVGEPEDVRNARLLFHAMPADTEEPSETLVPLFERAGEEGQGWSYETGGSDRDRTEPPLCLVWRNPMALGLPRCPPSHPDP